MTVPSIVKLLGAFLLGGGVGGVSVYYILSKKYDKKLNTEIQSYHDLLTQEATEHPERFIKAQQESIKNEEEKEQRIQADLSKSYSVNKVDYTQYFKKAVNEAEKNAYPTEDEDYDQSSNEPKSADISAPQIVSIEEYDRLEREESYQAFEVAYYPISDVMVMNGEIVVGMDQTFDEIRSKLKDFVSNLPFERDGIPNTVYVVFPNRSEEYAVTRFGGNYE